MDQYTAVIVEPREHKALSFVLNNILKNLSDEWKILIFYGKKNKKFLIDITNKLNDDYKDRIKIMQLNVDNLTREEYSKLLMNKEFYNHIPTETFLIFQTDSIIFEKNKLLINNFLKYDYVGAPWPFFMFHKYNIGNGGFSLRKKSKMLEVLEKSTLDCDIEDVFFSCNDLIYVPSFEEAKHFSIENIYCETAFACHQPWASPEYNKIIETYPEVKILRELNI